MGYSKPTSNVQWSKRSARAELVRGSTYGAVVTNFVAPGDLSRHAREPVAKPFEVKVARNRTSADGLNRFVQLSY